MMNSAVPWSTGGLVLVAPGGLAAPALGPALAFLAALLTLRHLDCTCKPADDPALRLSALAAEPPGWLLPLGLDPGQELAGSGCWADALAAWRQPVVLLVPATAFDLPAGAARAYDALLQQARVPVLGLVQIGGAAAPPRGDGLPWLGWLEAQVADAELVDQCHQALRRQLLRRWQALSVARPDQQRSDPAGAVDLPG